MKQKITIGRKDKASFPDLGLTNVPVKVDTGAYTSSIHCHKIELKKRKGEPVLLFTLLDPSYSQYKESECSTTKFRQKSIKNSFGISEKRYIIETDILIFGKIYQIQLSLSSRGEMKFPILIGRRFLKKKFIVDPSKNNLSFKNLNE